MDLDLFEDLMDMEDGSYIGEEDILDLPSSTSSNLTPGYTSIRRTQPARRFDMSLPLCLSTTEPLAGSVIAKLEDMLETVVDCLLASQPLTIRLKTRSKSTKQSLDPVTAILRNDEWAETKEISWPGKSQREAWKFSALLSIITLSHEALVTGVVMTKRDIFYRDPGLFIKQAVVDRYIDDLAYTLSISRHQLNVVATAKGLFNGCLGILKKDGTAVDCSSDLDGILVPDMSQIKDLFFRGLKWILIIEKEATFRTLCSTSHPLNSRAGKGLIITAKGYPDISTRSFLHMLRDRPLCPPIYALTDCDPHGLNILSTYAHGSRSLAHENWGLAVPDIRLLGVKLRDVVETQSRDEEVAGILTMTARDRKLATNMLASNPAFTEEMHADWRSELQGMLFLNAKAEIQILGGGGSLGKWLDRSILGWKEESSVI